MKQNKLNGLIRLLLFMCSLLLIVVLFVPLWRIDLVAPQYPEGLMLLIYPDKLAGNVDIINGLNHYIGMKTLHSDDFVEFKILPYIIIFFSLLCLLTSILANKKLLIALFTLFVIFGILAMYDFWRWEYDYGHNLNPDAAIIVPGMAYQPPLIGFKQLLNFGAYSFPDIGGWIFIAVGATLLFCIVYLWRKSIQIKKSLVQMIVLIGVVGISSCNHQPKTIKQGTDFCSFCKMTITDVKYAAELLNDKGKPFMFDDIKCAVTYLKMQDQVEASKYKAFLVDYSNDKKFIPAADAYILESEFLRTPMDGKMIAFSSSVELDKVKANYPGKTLTWQTITSR
jgi:copper chaperone NosL